MHVLFVTPVPRTLWETLTGRTLDWKPLPDGVATVSRGGTSAASEWHYAFRTRAQALKAKALFASTNAAAKGTFKLSVRERKTDAGLG
jgi:hypothetical protein